MDPTKITVDLSTDYSTVADRIRNALHEAGYTATVHYANHDIPDYCVTARQSDFSNVCDIVEANLYEQILKGRKGTYTVQ